MTFIGGPNGTVSSNNSCTQANLSGGDFAGTYDDVSNYVHITVVVSTDKSSLLNGLVFTFSSDSTNADKIYQYTVGVFIISC